MDGGTRRAVRSVPENGALEPGPRRLSMKSVVMLVVALGCLAGAVTTLAKRSAPSVSGVSFSPSTFAAAPAHAASASQRQATTIRFRLSERATIRVTIARKLAGRMSHGHCAEPTAKLSKRRACTRYVTVGKLARGNVKGGRATIGFSGRIHGKALTPGAYRGTIVAIDKDKHHSKPKRASFKVVKAGSQESQSPGTNANPSPPGSGSATCTSGPTNVAGGRDPWGGCFPGPSNTGVPAGTVLTAYTGPCTITTPNTVIDSKTVNCALDVRAANVTIRNSKVNNNVWLDQDKPGSAGWSMTITDSEVDAGTQNLPAICCGMYTVQRVNAHGGHNGAQCENGNRYCTIVDSWLHGQYLPDNEPWHLGGFLSDGSTNITLTHNTVVCDHAVNPLGEGCTGDINLIPNFAPVQGAQITRNLLGANTGSAYCTYGGEKSTSQFPHADHVVYQDNVFQRGTNRKCAAYGPVTGFAAGNPGNQWINNTWDDGKVVPPAN
jgi:hypothetical protein